MRNRKGYPSEKISLRSATADNVVIVDETGGGSRVIGEMDRPSAKELIFDNAVYIHLGRQYLVRKLDIENRTCHVAEKDVDYWTDSVVKTDIEVLTEDERSFVRRRGRRMRPRGRPRQEPGREIQEAALPQPRERRLWRDQPAARGDADASRRHPFPAGTRPAKSSPRARAKRCGPPCSRARRGSSTTSRPTFLMCDPRDLGRAERVRDPHFGCRALYFFDRYPGRHRPRRRPRAVFSLPTVAAARERLASCPCGGGCPSCIGVDFASERPRDEGPRPRSPRSLGKWRVSSRGGSRGSASSGWCMPPTSAEGSARSGAANERRGPPRLPRRLGTRWRPGLDEDAFASTISLPESVDPSVFAPLRRFARSAAPSPATDIRDRPGAHSTGRRFASSISRLPGFRAATGTIAFLAAVGRLAEGEFELTQVFLEDFPGEPSFLAALLPLLEGGIVVSYNGRAFDMPLLADSLRDERLRRRPSPLSTSTPSTRRGDCGSECTAAPRSACSSARFSVWSGRKTFPAP